jgi:hypothetical protein
MFIADIWSGRGADSGGPQRKILSAPLDGSTHQTELSQAPLHSSWLRPLPKNTDTAFKATKLTFKNKLNYSSARAIRTVCVGVMLMSLHMNRHELNHVKNHIRVGYSKRDQVHSYIFI